MVSVQFLVVTYAALYTGVFVYGAEISRSNRIRIEQLPKLSDTLAVAKSPFEPVTVAVSRTAGEDLLATSAPPATTPDKKLSTRAIQDLEQERDTTSASGQSDGQPAESKPVLVESAEATTPAESSETDASNASTESELSSTTVKLELDRSVTEAPATQAPVASSSSVAPEPEIPASTDSPAEDSTSDNKALTTISPTSTTSEPTSAAATEDSTTTTSTSTLAPAIIESVTQPARSADSTTEKASEVEVPEKTTAAPPREQTEPVPPKEKEQPIVPAVLPPAPETPPPAPSTASPESSTSAPEEEAAKPTEAPKETKVPCNHLPTYDSEEIQRVFREETTYKNGTIKGKFTYINFDQRYRLVHYTRLPYGPVKIDLVEELGRPEQGNTTTPTAAPASEIPNAVLQLRNILPNSLFGFPFLGPNVATNKPIEGRIGDQDSVNKYFYSTDTIATPNLLSPSVPVSILPGQGRLSQPINTPAADTLDDSYANSHIPTGSVGANLKPKQYEAGVNAQPFVLATPSNNLHFQYAIASHASHPDRHPGMIYPNLAQHQYQYSTLPVYAYPQPHYYPTARQADIVSQNGNKLRYEPALPDTPSGVVHTFSGHQTHQPHSHEHYTAPFMFAQPASPRNDQPESSRLRLKVKTSKSLNQETSGAKFAQLRAASSQHHHLPAASPANHVHRQHRQRAGKQNQELRATVNSSPVVYHVLRSPVGRMYTMSRNTQSHAIAFDHDD